MARRKEDAKTKQTRKRPVKKSLPARRIGPWFCCPRCGSRNVMYAQRRACYICRRCGGVFVVDWSRKATELIPEIGGVK